MSKRTKTGIFVFFVSLAILLLFFIIMSGDLGGLSQGFVPSLIASFFAAIIVVDMKYSSKKKNTNKATKNQSTTIEKPKRQEQSIFVCQPLSNNIFFEIKGNKVYKYQTNKVAYEIKNGKVYRYCEPSPILIINGNKLHAPGKSTPLYRVENNKVYEGDFTRKPIYDLRDSKHKYSQNGQR